MSKLHLRASLFAVCSLMPLVGCEVIDHDAADIEEAQGGASTDIIVNDEGQVIGSYDPELNRLDVDGNLAKGDSNATDDFSPLRVVVWEHSQFSGRSDAWYTSSGTLNLNLSGHRQNNVLSSLSIPAGCKATLYDGNLTTVLQTINSTKANVPSYINSLGSGVNDRVSSIKVECNTTTNTFCGYAYKDANFVGDRLPIYHHSLIRLTDSKFSGWNDTVSSVSANSNSVCDGIGLWADGNIGTGMNTSQARRHLGRSGDDSTLHDDGLGDLVSAIETDREVSFGELTHDVMGRVLTETREQRSWSKAFVCNLVDDICVSHGAIITGLTFLAGRTICAAIVGTGVVEAIAEVGAEIASDATATPVVAPLAAFTAAQIAKGVACWSAVGGTALSASAACDATMDTFCSNNVD